MQRPPPICSTRELAPEDLHVQAYTSACLFLLVHGMTAVPVNGTGRCGGAPVETTEQKF